MASEISSSPSSSGFAPLHAKTTPLPWDVFLSFYGEDTRNAFTAHLYDALSRNAIRTYKDEYELRTGDVILDALFQAIKDSKTCVIIFSENYASSGWCLDELVEICNCSEKMKKPVIGVYYNIEPSTVRYQTGSFAKHFEKHEIRYAADMDKVNKWRDALKKVAAYSGQHVSAGRNEVDIISEIVDFVLLEIKVLKTLPVVDIPVGLDPRVENITKLLRRDTERVTQIGLYGMGGVGKTTLAKALFNRLLETAAASSDYFKGSCFLAEVREVSSGANGLVSLQQQLLDKVSKSKSRCKVYNVEEGTWYIRERICSEKILVLIDDVEDLVHYKSLVGPFAPGSFVIVTTRNVQMLEKIEVEHIYEVDVLDGPESLELFTKHAFGNAVPDDTFMALSKEILPLAGGLPLALQVFGSHLFNEREAGWRAYIRNMQKNLHSTINDRLLISLDALPLHDSMLKEIFLDIACFFIGRKKEEVLKIMSTYYSNYSIIDHNIDILKKRCLLTINDKEELRMHDLLRDMGRKVVTKNYPSDAGKHSRLWISKEICHVLWKKKGTKKIEGIIPNNFHYEDALEGVQYDAETFRRMSNLRFLYLKNVRLNGSFEQIFENLSWLRWDCCPLECLPSEFCPQNLVILLLPHSKMTMLWDLNMDPPLFEKLTTLDMSYSLDLTKTPDFTALTCLETLNFMGCKRLEEVHISIGSLVLLYSLNLCGCVNLRSLPRSIGNLRALKSLNVGGCSSLEELPTELRNIESIEEFNAWGLTVPSIPISIRSLVHLNISDSTPTGWDVFLSFSGSDTRFNFISHLFSALDCHGVRTFMSEPEQLRGEVISEAFIQAIQQSKIYIVILSENYASSPWCLDGLVEILNCCKRYRRIVIPVFYNIDASVVLQQSGPFNKAFDRHLTGFAGEMVKVNKWRHTLIKVASFSGYNTHGRSEADIIEEIVGQILLKINSKNYLNVANHPVGLNYRVKGITKMLSSVTDGVIKFGIYGMGGIGKTTLAKAIYNQLLLEGSFMGSCFLPNVREVSGTTKGLESLQKQLINDVLKSKKIVEVESVDEGTMLIRETICSAKVLVLIDDISNLEQYESLVAPFSFGSVVIMTTRDEEILHKTEVELKYRYGLNVLNAAESLVLFTQHAFENAKPNNTLITLSKDILALAGGLPIALEVFGSRLFMMSEVGWKSYIEKLQQSPNASTLQKFIINLDALESDDPRLKNVFLDIACFFIGRKKEEVVQILETYYRYADHYIDVLKKRCLLTINNREELRMHDLLRDMGMEVVRNNYPYQPGKCSRLWALKDVQYVLKEKKGTEAIEGIIHHYSKYEDECNEVSFAAENFKRMSKLRFLYLDRVDLTGSFEHILKNLRWFCWKSCGLKCLPSEFYPDKLVILELPCSKMRTLFCKDKAYHVFEKLKTLNMSGSLDLTTTPDFTMLPCLETLNLEGCKGLKQVHVSIGYLVKLISLNLHDCANLRFLPDTVCNLPALKVLKLGHCSSLKALPNLSPLKQLKYLDLTNCSGLTEVQGLAELTSLSELYLTGCRSSLVSYALTQRFLQKHSEFGQAIKIYGTGLPHDWIGQSSDWNRTCESTNSSPNDSKVSLASSQNVLAITLFCDLYNYGFDCEDIGYSVENTRSDYIWSSSFGTCNIPVSCAVILPVSLFFDRDGDGIFNFSTDKGRIMAIYLLRKTEITTIEEYDGTTFKVKKDA